MLALEQNEKAILTVRKHWFALALRLLPLAPFIFIPIILFIFAETVDINFDALTPSVQMYSPEPATIPTEPSAEITIAPTNKNSHQIAFGVMLLFSWFLLTWISAFIIWTDYFLDVLIVTNKRIINIEQKGLFARETASLRLDKIQDITIEVNGILATFLSFGNMRIQTAGEQEEFTIHFIKNPESVKSAILKEHDRVMEELREVRIAKD